MLFDPQTGKVVDPDGLRSITFAGEGMTLPKPVVIDGNKVTPVVREDDGTIGGTSTEHPSGRIDATVHARAAHASASTQGT